MITAAGVGLRMDSDIPKQYLTINDKTILDYSIKLFLDTTFVRQVVVILSSDDKWFNKSRYAKHPRVVTAIGGSKRVESVLNGLQFLSKISQPNDWVLVHDAVRPCLHPCDLQNLVNALEQDPIGGILAQPISDTLKKASQEQSIEQTICRNQMWAALTPQMFRIGALIEAIKSGIDKNLDLTDDASAFEAMGIKPKLIACRHPNLKITWPSDLMIAEAILQKRKKG